MCARGFPVLWRLLLFYNHCVWSLVLLVSVSWISAICIFWCNSTSVISARVSSRIKLSGYIEAITSVLFPSTMFTPSGRGFLVAKILFVSRCSIFRLPFRRDVHCPGVTLLFRLCCCFDFHQQNMVCIAGVCSQVDQWSFAGLRCGANFAFFSHWANFSLLVKIASQH